MYFAAFFPDKTDLGCIKLKSVKDLIRAALKSVKKMDRDWRKMCTVNGFSFIRSAYIVRRRDCVPDKWVMFAESILKSR